MKIGLCADRHNMPVLQYIFPREIDMFNYEYMRSQIEKKIPVNTYMVELYVTGMTTAVVEVVKYCYENEIPLTLMHYNKDKSDYERQIVL